MSNIVGATSSRMNSQTLNPKSTPNKQHHQQQQQHHNAISTHTYQRKRPTQLTALPSSMSLNSIKSHQMTDTASNVNDPNSQTSNIFATTSQKTHLSALLSPTNINSNSITINIHNNNMNNLNVSCNNEAEYSGKKKT